MFTQELESAKKNYGVGGGGDNYFKMKRGKNRVRILAGGKAIASHYVNEKNITCVGMENGCPYHGENAPKDKEGNPLKPRVRFLFYVLDKTKEEPTIELAFLPFIVMREINTFAENEDYCFDFLPMPYDINITYDPDEAPAKMYNILPSPKRDEVDKGILEELKKKTPVEEIIEKIKDKIEYPQEEIKREITIDDL